MKKNIIILLFISAQFCGQSQTQTYFPDSSAMIRQRLEEWQDLKFGLLMHWGPYSQWGIVESWSICPEDLSWASGGRKSGVADNYNDYVTAYEGLQKTFNPEKFDPEKWAAAAKQAGMKYVVFTTKHHDGFCMFDTKLTDYKITDTKTPFHSNSRSNITKEIFDAFRAANFWTGAYFSKPDWHCNDYWWDQFPPADRNCNYAIEKYPERWENYIQYTHAQIDELMRNYGKIDILWLDGGWVRPIDSTEVMRVLSEKYEGSRWARNPQSQDIRMHEIVRNARAIQQDLIVVDRAVPGPYQNYLTPEQHIPEEGLPYPWETCMTMANSWSFVPGDKYKSSPQLIEHLVDVVSKGGNFLLNIGPSPKGELDSIAYQRLSDIGKWMNKNGEAIYNTRIYDTKGESNGIRYTRSKDQKTVYIFIPANLQGEITLDHLPYQRNKQAVLLDNGTTVRMTNKQGKTMIKGLPKNESRFVRVVRVG